MAQKDYKSVKDKASASVLAEVNKQKQENGDKSKTFGEYDEAPGGGTPGAKGGRGSMNKNFVVAEDPDDPAAIEAKENGQAVRYMQPRDEDGQFTYNAANGKKLSTKKSRGTTKVPWLHGVDLTFFTEGSEFKTEWGRTLVSTTYTADELVESCKVYLDDERGFAGLVGTAITKKGRESKASKDIEQGKSSNVDTSKLSQNTQNELAKAAANKPGSVDYTYKPNPNKNKINPNKVTVPPNVMKKKTVNNNDFDQNTINDIKSNPQKAKEFVDKNKDKIQEIMRKNPKATEGKILALIASGRVKSFSDLL